MNNNIENETNSIAQYQKIHFTIMAIEASAKKMNISGQEMYNRLKRQDLINQRLLKYYELLHTQSLDYVVEDTLETLHNWEKEELEEKQ